MPALRMQECLHSNAESGCPADRVALGSPSPPLSLCGTLAWGFVRRGGAGVRAPPRALRLPRARRQTAAGDQLRIVYDQLSKDPNSLSNLDQDLPNYTQHQAAPPSYPACSATASCSARVVG